MHDRNALLARLASAEFILGLGVHGLNVLGMSTHWTDCHSFLLMPMYTPMDSTQKKYLSPIRPTVRAVIFRNGELLVQVKQKAGESPHLTLPGGKQEPGESAHEALKRECAEEIGTSVTVGELLHVAEVFKNRQEGTRHQLELLFACTIPEDYTPVVGPHPDPSQTGTIWASPRERMREFQPDYAEALTRKAPLYLGLLNG